ncbi:MAG: hypothetical protein IID51_06675 [Proteobacteria bacterium]|nr:hypothetical protein [Pseudomonadota bacterium]
MLVLFTIKTPKTPKRFWFVDDFIGPGCFEINAQHQQGQQSAIFEVRNPPLCPPEIVPSVHEFVPRNHTRRAVPSPRHLKAELTSTARFRKLFLDIALVGLLTDRRFSPPTVGSPESSRKAKKADIRANSWNNALNRLSAGGALP